MSSIKNILVHLDASPRSPVRIQVARQLAEALEARLTGVYAVTSNFVEMPFAVAESAEAGAIVLKLDADRRERALALFEKARSGPGADVAWTDIGTEPTIWGLTQRAYFTDLLVMGQHDASAPTARDLPPDLIESVVIGSGKPALVLPYAGEVETVGKNVLVAWRATRESARALSCAMPLLARASQVHVVAWTEEQGARQAGEERAQLEQYLQSHGISPTFHWYGNGHGQPADRLLSLTTDLGTDLLVMGCYGHSRARELVLGGTSRTVLKSMTVPVLMAH